MKSFELFLDESGNFSKTNEENLNRNPSLIGGILVNEGQLSEMTANFMLENKKLHISEEREDAGNNSEKKDISEKQVKLLENIKEKGYEFVIFENLERLTMNSPQELYLSMMSEGIANLMERLCIENPNEPISLTVRAAVKRRDPKKRYANSHDAVFQLEDYEPLLIEKVQLKLVQHEYYVTKNSNIEFKLDSTNYSYRLMLCDAVCNAYLTVGSKKFNEEQKQRLEKVFENRKYMFKIYREEYQIMLSKYLAFNKIVDSIFLAFEEKNKENRVYITNAIAKSLDNMSREQIIIQNDLIKMKIEDMLKIQRNIRYSKEFVKLIQDEICSKLKSNSFEINKLKLDISLYLLTVYTHEGKNLESEKIIKLCEKQVKFLEGNIVYIEYLNILKNRKSIFYIDCLSYEKAAYELNEIIDKNRQINTTLKTLIGKEDIKSDSLGKDLGTRLQAYTNMIRSEEDLNKKEDIYNLAVKDWEEAVSLFTSASDITRQYNYRSNLECEMQNYDNALLYLYKGLIKNDKITKENVLMQLKPLLKEILDVGGIYSLSQLIKIMGESSNTDLEFANEIFKVIDNSYIAKCIILGDQIPDISINANNLFDESKKVELHTQHPYELIYTYYGIYLANVGNKKQANQFFESALNVIEKTNSMTLDIYEISIYANMYLSLNDENYIIKLKEKANTLYSKYYLVEDGMEYPSNKILLDIKIFIDMLDINKKDELEFGAKSLVNLIRI